MSVEVEAEGREVTAASWAIERRKFSVTAGEVTEARLRTLYYPHWKASAGGRELSTRPAPDGALLVSLPAEAAEVMVEFREPLRVQTAGVVTALAWVLIAAFLIFNWRKEARRGRFSPAG
jgi:hypothetical protein